MIEFDFSIIVGETEVRARGCQDKPKMGLFGPSGCGKTTILNCIAGLAHPDKGIITLNGVTLFDDSKKINVPAHKRAIGYVFQDKRLFPHMSVKTNIEYGRRHDGAGPEISELAEVFGLDDILDRQPTTLSGGEYQRVALARTLAASPGLLLLDEPLVSIDMQSKLRILPYLVKAYDVWRIPYVYVSHSLSEILFLTDMTWEMKQGEIIQTVNPINLLSRSSQDIDPILNILEGRVVETPQHTGFAIVSSDDSRLSVPNKGLRVNEPISVAIPSSDLIISTAIPHGISARNVLPARIKSMEQNGYALWVIAESGSDRFIVELTEEAGRELALEPEKAVYLIFKSHSALVTSLDREWNNEK